MYLATLKMYKAYNNKLAEKVAASVGNPYGSVTSTATTPLPLKMFREGAQSELVPQPAGLHALDQEYMRQHPNHMGKPIIVTSSEYVSTYEAISRFYSGNDEGKDGTKRRLENVYYDPALASHVDPLVTTDPAVSFLAGSLNLIEYFLYDQETRKMVGGRNVFTPLVNTPNIYKGKVDIGTPFLGRKFEVDMLVIFKECEGVAGKIVVKMKKIFDLYSVDQSAFCSADTHNFRLLHDLQCATFGCADL
jgi:hypothetical protein